MTTTQITESAATANARSRMATVRDLAHTYGPTMDAATDAANHALLAAMEARVIAREAWDRANAAHLADGPITDTTTALGDAARRNANAAVSSADLTAGIVSSVACGLHGVTREGRAFQVESTNAGDYSLHGVRYLGARRNVEGPIVTDVVRFFPNNAAGLTAAHDLAGRILAGLY